ncbi:hypothetical protein [Virgibacillus salexigens]|uniref:Uncharacterized protein n=1 Tax=Virgibacillus kapii TaxID=1638645 RepID=A0ABQ2DEU1_9BACI|nr:hypothetical protein [Virgibacillus kapii]GGJ55298.1 hypothetical protein GCM10007111_17010 [Virgibacillus kapii]
MRKEEKDKIIIALLFGTNQELEMQRNHFSKYHDLVPYGNYIHYYFENPSDKELERLFKKNDVLEYQIFSVGVFNDLIDLHKTVRIAHQNGKKILFGYENITSNKTEDFQKVLFNLMLYYNPERKIWL